MTPADIESLARRGGVNQKAIYVGVYFAEDIAPMLALVRQEALEEAAMACDAVYYQNIGEGRGEVRYGIAACAAAIRAMKEADR